jgi:uncharacterized membrane-anchored protein
MRLKPVLFIAVAIAQLAVPAWMIMSRERVLRDGEAFKFRTAPIDPRDPFRGEYVHLDFDAENGAWAVMDTSGNSAGEQDAFALLSRDSAGYARIAALLTEPPAEGAFVRVQYYSWGEDSITQVSLPFDRFYLEEGDGPRTEKLLMPQWGDGIVSDPLPAYALVRVLNGQAVIEDLIVDERSIREWLSESLSEQPARRPTVIATPDSPATMRDTVMAAPAPGEQP